MTVELKVIQVLRSLTEINQQTVLQFAEFLQTQEIHQSTAVDRQTLALFGDGLSTFRQKWQIESLDINPDEVFLGVRDPSPGREVVL
ncbi:hypothetical protein VB712_12400 [Spirulina sp. CCNP1310]|uniref:hypothetical protein n=1 Tax=Spirulina sp. CCNP1310 TaxID=3110249 RepID=UPI002B20C87A|nr:hypothetical protein [Spirulina sp. CCNP1310]MEA5420023.1 hypothetical protein [Spirulina sp. CCNP1310]